MTEDPFDLPWTRATIDLYKASVNTGAHVMNHELSTSEGVDRTLRFAKARLRWFRRHLPAGAAQVVWLDDRGQDLAAGNRDRLRTALDGAVGFLSEKKG